MSNLVDELLSKEEVDENYVQRSVFEASELSNNRYREELSQKDNELKSIEKKFEEFTIKELTSSYL